MKNYVLASATWKEYDDGKYVNYYWCLINGSYWYGDVLKAKRFDFDELIDYLKEHRDLTYLGFNVVRIDDCVWERLENNDELLNKYRDINYVIR